MSLNLLASGDEYEFAISETQWDVERAVDRLAAAYPTYFPERNPPCPNPSE